MEEQQIFNFAQEGSYTILPDSLELWDTHFTV